MSLLRCLLPVFALGRAQEILLILEDYWERNSDLHEIPIFYNSPMATKCLRIFETYTNMCSVSVQEQANRCNNPWVLKYIQNMPDRHSFAAAEAEMGACVVLADTVQIHMSCPKSPPSFLGQKIAKVFGYPLS
ncbi:Cpsf73 [Symbiodinium natans]|uniref:Cpsf73 protein n=1 Tax=Symbiodinium natans TaxID=878477 RepID=A0A812J2Q9_9DINO|nr:Cpsf73 [Symbiodinium natans]